MTKLSVNINKLATLRNARGKNNPDLLQWALEIVSYGAHGITVHPRPDERHIRERDVYDLSALLTVEFNIEGYPDERFLSLVTNVKPTQCTLVPDPPHILTSNAGFCVATDYALLQRSVDLLQEQGIRTAIFLDPTSINATTCDLLQKIAPDRVELYTEAYANAYNTIQQVQTLAQYAKAAQDLLACGIELNAGHDLNCENLALFTNTIPQIKEVSIGHALVCDALRWGMAKTIQRYLACLALKNS